MMYFNGTAYQVLFPFLILLFLKKKHLALNLLVALNYTLILYAVTLSSRIYHLIKFIQQFSPINNYHYTIGFFEIRMMLIVLIAVLFLFKKMDTNVLLSFTVFALLWMNDYYFSLESVSVETIFKMLNYFSLFVAVYALLWLTNQLPSQRTSHV